MCVHWSNWVWNNSPYDRTKLLIHLAFAEYASAEGDFWPLQESVAKKCRCTSRYVQETLKDMRERGLIESMQRGYHISNLYQLLVPSHTKCACQGINPRCKRDELGNGSDGA